MKDLYFFQKEIEVLGKNRIYLVGKLGITLKEQSGRVNGQNKFLENHVHIDEEEIRVSSKKINQFFLTIIVN